MTTKFKDVILEIIKQRTIIDENKPLTYYLKMENKVNKLSEEDCEKLVMNILEDINPKRKSIFSGIAIANSAANSWGLTYLLYRAIRGKFDKCSKACGTYVINGPKRQICMAKCNVMKWQEVVDGLKKIKASPDKILKAERKLEKASQKFKEYLNYAKETGKKYEISVKPGMKNRFRVPIKTI